MPNRRLRIADRRISRLRRTAIQYVEHGWPVARLAVPCGGQCPCGLLDCVEPHLMLGSCPLITSPEDAEQAFATDRWAIALQTLHFDVLDIPARFGAPLHYQLKTSCPTALAPTNRRWQFLVTPRSVPRPAIETAGGRIFSGASGWIAAPGTATEASGRIRWLVPPYLTSWRPYERRDPIDVVFGTHDWSASAAPSPQLAPLVGGALD